MELIVVGIVAICLGVVIGWVCRGWSGLESEQEESAFFSDNRYSARVLHVGKHRRADSFPISNVHIPERMSAEDERELDDTMGFLAAVKAELQPPEPGRETQVITLSETRTTSLPEPLAIEPPTWAQEHAWHGKSLEEMVAELEQKAYATS